MKNFELKTNAPAASNVKSFNKFKKFAITKSKQKHLKGGDGTENDNGIVIEDWIDI